VAGQIDAMGVVDDAIENGVGVGRIADQVVPFVDWDLAGDDGRSAAIAFFEDLEKIVSCGGRRDATRSWCHDRTQQEQKRAYV